MVTAVVILALLATLIATDPDSNESEPRT